MVTRSVTVTNPLGLHARAAARFVHLATRFASQIRVTRDAKVMDGKSIMGILLLAAARGTTLTISADGPDEANAVQSLIELVATLEYDICVLTGDYRGKTTGPFEAALDGLARPALESSTGFPPPRPGMPSRSRSSHRRG